MFAVTVLASIFMLLASAESVEKLPKSDPSKVSCEPYETECPLGCCPYPDAVCCSDGFECCPSGTTCIPYIGMCVGFNEKNHTLSYEKSVPIKSNFQDQEVVAQTEKSVEDDNQIQTCPAGTTPCGIGCCPFRNAICCADKIHCCPNGYTCNFYVGGCTKGSYFVPFFPKNEKLSPSNLEFQNTAMNSLAAIYYQTEECPPRTTPCGAGCCPLPHAVCCSDGLHCCPKGYICNYEKRTCRKGLYSTPFFWKTEISSADPENIAVTSIDSADLQIQACPYGTTPCGAGCCPLPNAICCSDGIHCCPNGYTCNYAMGGCTRGSNSMPFFQKIEKIYFTDSQNSAVTSIYSDNRKLLACPSRSGRCTTGCCPVPNGVCCSDGVHCCPSHYICNYAAGGCTMGSHYSPFLHITRKVLDPDTEEFSMTPLASADQQIQACSPETTPCGAGCCPFPNAVCCSDEIHCCPKGYTCNYDVGGCTFGSYSMPFLKRIRKVVPSSDPIENH